MTLDSSAPRRPSAGFPPRDGAADTFPRHFIGIVSVTQRCPEQESEGMRITRSATALIPISTPEPSQLPGRKRRWMTHQPRQR